jgi:aerotaxis receptor
MKQNLPITQQEQRFAAGLELISATDPKGVITFANQALVDISGFSAEQLIGSSHNVVRHPDMPPAAFEDMWATLRQGRSWMGLVKNRCKNGDHYWVDAFVTPSFEGEELVGYESVRVSPDPAAVERAEKHYRKLWKSGSRTRLPRLGLAGRISAAVAGAAAIGLAGGVILGGFSPSVAVLVWITVSTLSIGAAQILLSGLRRAADEARKIADNPTMQQVYTGRDDEIGTLLFANLTLNARLRTVLGRIRETAAEVAAESEQLSRTAAQMTDSMLVQQQELDMIATAAEEMSANVQEVSRSATSASQATEQTNQRATTGRDAINEAVTITEQVANGVARATDTIQTLEKDSEAIGTVLEVIRGIAEQTNLLALNAAIEAARAGEQGRGFAVVADEVRTLASRTQASTAEIESMIERLQGGARDAVTAMQDSRGQVDSSVAATRQVDADLQEIFSQVAALEDMGRAIAKAADEQSNVSEEVARNVHRISGASVNLTNGSEATRSIGDKVAQQAAELKALIRRFSA